MVGASASWSPRPKGIGVLGKGGDGARHAEELPESGSCKMERDVGEAEVAGAGTRAGGEPGLVPPAWGGWACLWRQKPLFFWCQSPVAPALSLVVWLHTLWTHKDGI